MLAGTAALLGAVVAGVVTGAGPLEDAVREITLPLRHEDVIRQQASDKDIDPALIAAVIFEQADLATPQINIAYGAWYLRFLIDHYEGNEALAVAAYNAGLTNVDRWVERAGGPPEFDSARHIPFPETRAYVENVMERRGQYREHYGGELGL
jgi:soluble lytic murein transglycosylase